MPSGISRHPASQTGALGFSPVDSAVHASTQTVKGPTRLVHARTSRGRPTLECGLPTKHACSRAMPSYRWMHLAHWIQIGREPLAPPF